MSLSASVHRYRVFGLDVDSCVSLPAVERDGGAPAAIEIVEGAVAERLDGATAESLRHQVAPGRRLLTVDHVARFLVEAGRRVTIARAPQADDDDVRAFLLGPVFGALLEQRHDLVLHACAVAIAGEGALILGRGGAGKSTLAAALRQRGAEILSDEVAVVRPADDGRLRLQPGFAALKLWPEAIEQLGLPLAATRPVRRELARRCLVFEARSAPAVPVRRIYLLHSRGDGAAIEPVGGMRKLNLLNQHRHGSELRADPREHLAAQHVAVQLARDVPLAIVRRPHRWPETEAFVGRVWGDFHT